MTRRMTWMALAMAMVGLCGMSSPEARAQCGGPMKTALRTARPVPGGAALRMAGWSGQELDEWADERDRHGLEPIVGLWKTDFEDPQDNYSDKGYQTWHSDYTEFLNSGRPPSIGAVCEGVWEKIGRSTFRLNHFAMGFGDGVHYNVLYQFRQIVAVDATRNHFVGTFTIHAYDPVTHKGLGEYKGTVTGERVRIGTTAESQ